MREPIAGRHAVLAALRSPREVHSVLAARDADPASIREIQQACAPRGCVVQFVGQEELMRILGTNRHQGVGAVVGALPLMGPRDLVNLARNLGQEPLIIALDGIEDPQNVGAIARSALLAGAHGMIVPERGTAKLGVGAQRAASGALSTLPVCQEANLRTALEALRKEGVWIVGADANGGKAPWDVKLVTGVCFVLGSEHDGLGRQALDALDERVRIPTPGGELSLNVSSAAAVLMFEAVRQRSRR